MYNKNRKHIPIACELYIKIDYPDILEDKYESYCGDGIVDWFISSMSYYNKLFKEIFSINFPLKEDSIIHPSIECDYCNEYMGEDIARNHDHLNGKFRGYALNEYKFQDKNAFVPIYAFNSTNYDNHLFITKLAEKIRLKVLTKTDEIYICIDMGYAKA